MSALVHRRLAPAAEDAERPQEARLVKGVARGAHRVGVNADSFNRDHVPRTYESYPAAASSSWVPVSSATSSALQNRGASSCAGSAFTYAAHPDLSPMDLSWRSWSATAIQPASSPQCAPIGDASAVSTVIHSDRGIASTASPPPMSSAATRPQPRPPGAASTIAGDTLLTSTPSDPSPPRARRSRPACGSPPTRPRRPREGGAGGERRGRATFGGRWAPEVGASWRDVSRAVGGCEAESTSSDSNDAIR